MRAKIPLLLATFLAAIFALNGFWYLRRQPLPPTSASTDSLPLLQSTNNRTNLLLLGIGGDGHEGGELTDSLLLVSLYHPTNQLTLISLPRDLWVKDVNRKINALYYEAEKLTPNTGLNTVKTTVSSLLNLPVHYTALLDFSGFIKAIDAVGGITVNVERSFDDYKYPIPGLENAEPESTRYEHLHFEAGQTKMDGVTALKFVRSRHAEGAEGTDFARSERQKLVIRSFMRALFSTQTVFNPERLKTLYHVVQNSLVTDLNESHLPTLTKLALSVNTDSIATISFVDQLYNPSNLSPYYGQWVLLPKTNWEDIQEYVRQNLAQ